MAKKIVKPVKNIENLKSEQIENVKPDEKLHIGNVKLSEQKKAIKIHIFKTNKFYVIPLQEISRKIVGKVYEYIDGAPEIVGEILPPMNKNSHFYQIRIKTSIYSLKDTYVDLLLNETNLTLSLFEE